MKVNKPALQAAIEACRNWPQEAMMSSIWVIGFARDSCDATKQIGVTDEMLGCVY